MKPNADAPKPLSKAEKRRQAAELHNANYAYKSYVNSQESGLSRIKAQAALEARLDAEDKAKEGNADAAS